MTRFIHLAAALCWVAPTLLLFSWTLRADRLFAYRDAAHYYRPLWMYVQDQMEKGNLPLLSPEERGRPLLADPTVAMFYPPKIVFALPIDFDAAYKLFLVGHVLLAFFTMLVAAKRFHLDWSSALFAGVTYAFGGAIVSQTCNAPYLVGAAWLPLGVAAGYQVVQRGRVSSALELSSVLALMVLGGDPQLAYLLGLSLVLLNGLAAMGVSGLPWPRLVRSGAGRLILLVMAGGLAVGLSSVQWMPTAEWAAESERRVLAKQAPSLFDVTTTDSRYRFSVGPWRWIELFWPNIAGKPFPIHTRWMSAIRAEGRIWAPTLYMGLLTPFLAIASIRFRGGRLGHRWLSWVLVLSIAGSLGRFGIGWMINELNGHGDGPIRDEVGGVYWVLVQLLPGFGVFRYPAKLWTFAALSLSLLSSMRVDELRSQRQPMLSLSGLRRFNWLAMSFILVIAIWMLSPWWKLVAPHADSLFGPFQVQAAVRQLMFAALHGSLVVGVLCVLAKYYERRTMRTMVVMLSLTTAIDLGFAHRWLQPSAPRDAFNSLPELTTSDVVHRARTQGWYPNAWCESSSPSRFEECIRWDQRTLRAKHPLSVGVGSLCGYTSFSTVSQRALESLLDELNESAPDKLASVVTELGASVICRDVSASRNARPSNLSLLDAKTTRVAMLRPLAWIPANVRCTTPEVVPSATEDSIETWKVFLRHVLLPEAEPFKTLTHCQVFASNSEKPHIQRGQIACEVEACHKLRLVVDLEEEGWIVVNRLPLKDWQAISSESQEQLEIARANGVMMAVKLPAGRQEVTLSYAPRALRLGVIISAISSTLLLLGSIMTWRRQRRIGDGRSRKNSNSQGGCSEL